MGYALSFKEFILSEKKKDRIKRHLLFWGFWGFYFTMVRFLNPMAIIQTGKFPDFLKVLVESLIMFLPQTVLVYSLIGFVLPRYVFTGRYLAAAAWFLVFLFLTFTITAAFILFVPYYKAIFFPTIREVFAGQSSWSSKIFLAYMASLQGALTGAALATSFKLFKHYYVKNIRNEQLQRENTDAQLQLLKAQVHPHFLFNTLNNIYSQAQGESPRSAKMVMELSHILRYVLDEGKLEKVPLENELQMLMDYINLERIRYDKKLELHVSLPEHTENLYIAPLLLLPLVENCFKHGASKMLHHPWINLKITLDKQTLTMKLMNGRKGTVNKPALRKGTGIENLKQRLELLYPGKYELEIRKDEEVFVVDLKLELETRREAIDVAPGENQAIPKEQYA